MIQDTDKFASLREMSNSGNGGGNGSSSNPRFWNYETDGDVMGTIIDFNSFDNPLYGEQHTVIVRLADSGELISAFVTSKWLQEGLKRQSAEIGDLILIRYFGRVRPTDRFKTYDLHIEKVRKFNPEDYRHLPYPSMSAFK
jgi:hypothetical protein